LTSQQKYGKIPVNSVNLVKTWKNEKKLKMSEIVKVKSPKFIKTFYPLVDMCDEGQTDRNIVITQSYGCYELPSSILLEVEGSPPKLTMLIVSVDGSCRWYADLIKANREKRFKKATSQDDCEQRSHLNSSVFIDRAKVIMEVLKSANIDTRFMGDFLNKIF